MTEIVVRVDPSGEVTLRLNGAAATAPAGTTALPVRGVLSERGVEIETSTQLEQLHRADETEVSTTGDRNGL